MFCLVTFLCACLFLHSSIIATGLLLSCLLPLHSHTGFKSSHDMALVPQQLHLSCQPSTKGSLLSNKRSLHRQWQNGTWEPSFSLNKDFTPLPFQPTTMIASTMANGTWESSCSLNKDFTLLLFWPTMMLQMLPSLLTLATLQMSLSLPTPMTLQSLPTLRESQMHVQSTTRIHSCNSLLTFLVHLHNNRERELNSGSSDRRWARQPDGPI